MAWELGVRGSAVPEYLLPPPSVIFRKFWQTLPVKVAFPLALVGSIVGEFIGGNQGVGYLILSGQFSLDTPLVFASLLSITLFTTLGIGAVVLAEELFLGWRPSRRR